MRVNCNDCPCLKISGWDDKELAAYVPYRFTDCALSEETVVETFYEHNRYDYSDNCKLVKIVLNDGTVITPVSLEVTE